MFTQSFTDPQGTEHVSAVFQVARANMNTNKSENLDLVFSEGDYSSGTNNLIGNESNNLSYKIYYWSSEEMRAGGSMPYVLYGDNMQESHSANSIGAEYDGLTLEEKVEKHCKEVVLVQLSA